MSQLAHTARQMFEARIARYNDPNNLEYEWKDLETAHRWERHAFSAFMDLVAAEEQVASLTADIDKFWTMLHNCWDIEPREYFEKGARVNGFESPLAMAAHYMWKRDAKVASLTRERDSLREVLKSIASVGDLYIKPEDAESKLEQVTEIATAALATPEENQDA